MTLKEKFEKAEINEFEIMWLSENGIVNLEKIADDYAIEFINWLSFNDLFYSIQFGNHSTKELLEIFKKEKGLCSK